MFRPKGYLDDPYYTANVDNAVAMATKEIQYHRNGGAPFITVSTVPPEPVNKDVHFYHYYNNGSNNNSPRRSPNNGEFPESYVVIGTIEYGRLTSIDPSRSTPGVNSLPSRVLTELQAVYSTVPNALVIVMNSNGKITIQTHLTGLNDAMNSQFQNFSPRPPQVPPQVPPQAPPQPQYGQYPVITHIAGVPRVPNVPAVPGVPPGAPVIIYKSPPLPRRRKVVYEDSSDSSSETDEETREQRRIDDHRSELEKRHSQIYGYIRVRDDKEREIEENPDYYRDKKRHRRKEHRDHKGHRNSYHRDDRRADYDDDRSRDQSARTDDGRETKKGIYRTGKPDDRRNRNSNQDRVLADHSRR